MAINRWNGVAWLYPIYNRLMLWSLAICDRFEFSSPWPRPEPAKDNDEISDETKRTFAAISDLANAHLFTIDSALEAFIHIEDGAAGEAVRNQCDGCVANAPFTDLGHHRYPGGSVVACTAARYTPEAPQLDQMKALLTRALDILCDPNTAALDVNTAIKHHRLVAEIRSLLKSATTASEES